MKNNNLWIYLSQNNTHHKLWKWKWNLKSKLVNGILHGNLGDEWYSYKLTNLIDIHKFFKNFNYISFFKQVFIYS